jgi:uncharacterized protein with ParB-like and HNH nuclease domain
MGTTKVSDKPTVICLKSISVLLGETFFIPAYQRGYRWDSKQVTDLLEDIMEFTDKPNKKDTDFYCLQPIVVKKDDEQYKVVDGHKD